MSKKYKGKICVYCAVAGASDTADHVVCREFFPEDERGNLPKVPSCAKCNSEKSRLEHYLTAVLPFGGRQPSASAILADLVPKRLSNNERLRAELASGVRYRYMSRNGGPWRRQMAMPFDGERLNELFAYIMRGLAFHHWGLIFGQDHVARISFVREMAQSFFDVLLAMNGVRISGDLGKGVFVYQGLQAHDDPYITVWRVSLYGAEAEAERPSGRVQWAYGLTAPRSSPEAAVLSRIFRAS